MDPNHSNCILYKHVHRILGILRDPDISPQTRIINAAHQITYLLAMSVFSVFAGTLIFFVIKFRARGEEDEL